MEAGDPLQIFVEVLLGASIYLVVLWQYLAGHAVARWSAEAERQWRVAGRFLRRDYCAEPCVGDSHFSPPYRLTAKAYINFEVQHPADLYSRSG
jgi:hypothetical protein